MTYLTNMRLLEVLQRHLLMVQYTGDYREAVQRSTEGGGETYYAQKYSVDAVAAIGKQIEEAAVICCMRVEPYNEVVKNGVRGIGAGLKNEVNSGHLIELIKNQSPTHFVVCTPIREVFQWASKKMIPTIAVLSALEPLSSHQLTRCFPKTWGMRSMR